MKMTAVPIVGGTYADDTRPFTSQDCVNYIPEQADASNTRSPAMLRGLPGLRTVVTGLDGFVRGIHNVEGVLFVVAGSKLYKLSEAFVATELGTINGIDRVGMAHNQITGGNQLAIGSGSSGYIYDTVAGTLTQITDEGFPGTPGFTFADSYLAGVEPFGRFWFHSALADGLSYNTLDRYEAEAAPDLILQLLQNHRELWAVGQRTIEPFADTGSNTTTWQRIPGVVIEQGGASKWSAVVLDNAVLLLGNDGIFYRIDGYTLHRISTHAIEQSIRGLNWSACFAYTWTDMGHKVAYWTFPDGHTWGYDVSSGLWHRRESYRLNKSRISCMAWWNGQWVAGDYQQGKLFVLDWDEFEEDGDPFIAERVTGVLTNQQNRFIVNCAELVMDTGRSAVGESNNVELCYSDDGGYNFSRWRAASLGGAGSYGKRVRFWRLGSALNRVWRVRVAAPCKRDIIAASLAVEDAS